MTVKKLVVFDLDKTLIDCDTGSSWQRYMAKKGLMCQAEVDSLEAKVAADYAAGTLDMEKVYPRSPSTDGFCAKVYFARLGR